MQKTLADIGEFGLINRIQKILNKKDCKLPEVTLGIGDDTAAFNPKSGFELLVTCDCLVEGTHFLPDYITPHELGRRAMAINISDIGAMGGRPLYALVSLGLNPQAPVKYIEDMYLGFLDELNPLEACIIGGNLTKTQKPLFIDITVIGEVEIGRKLLRSSAKPGDKILVTGYPGQSAAGLKILLNEGKSDGKNDHPLIRAYNTPSHRAKEGQAIAQSGCGGAMIDTSDGFLSDLRHICVESHVGADLVEDKFPISEALRDAAARLNCSPVEFFLQASDDYELIFTCTPENVNKIRSAVSAVSDVPVSEIGWISKSAGKIQIERRDGTLYRPDPSGWNHYQIKEENNV
jgi:thiamine-monophosphate kinase